MPIVCAAQGDKEVEYAPKSLQNAAQLPIGLFEYTDPLGRNNTTSPSEIQKREIIREYLSSISLECTRIYLLDEVQKGGTISQAAILIQNLLNSSNKEGRKDVSLRLIAAQDSRIKVVRQEKKPAYKNMASNNWEGIISDVISFPLIATDRTALLDRVALENYRLHGVHDISSHLFVIPNLLAQQAFYSLGSMARNPDVRNDGQYQWNLLNEQCRDLSEDSSAKAEDWLSRVVTRLNSKTHITHST